MTLFHRKAKRLLPHNLKAAKKHNESLANSKSNSNLLTLPRELLETIIPTLDNEDKLNLSIASKSTYHAVLNHQLDKEDLLLSEEQRKLKEELERLNQELKKLQELYTNVIDLFLIILLPHSLNTKVSNLATSKDINGIQKLTKELTTHNDFSDIDQLLETYAQKNMDNFDLKQIEDFLNKNSPRDINKVYPDLNVDLKVSLGNLAINYYKLNTKHELNNLQIQLSSELSDDQRDLLNVSKTDVLDRLSKLKVSLTLGNRIFDLKDNYDKKLKSTKSQLNEVNNQIELKQKDKIKSVNFDNAKEKTTPPPFFQCTAAMFSSFPIGIIEDAAGLIKGGISAFASFGAIGGAVAGVVISIPAGGLGVILGMIIGGIVGAVGGVLAGTLLISLICGICLALIASAYLIATPLVVTFDLAVNLIDGIWSLAIWAWYELPKIASNFFRSKDKVEVIAESKNEAAPDLNRDPSQDPNYEPMPMTGALLKQASDVPAISEIVNIVPQQEYSQEFDSTSKNIR